MASLGKWDTQLNGSNQGVSPAFQRGIQNSSQGNQQTALNTILPILGGGLGAVAGAGVGGFLGLETGPGALATGYLGGVAGAGAGAAAGNAGADMLNQVLFNKNINPQESVQNTIGQAKAGAIGEAVGGPIAKSLGFIAHPIKPFIDMVDKTLANSAKKVNIGDMNGLLSQFEKQIVPKLTQDGYGPEAQNTYNSLQSRITGMAQSRMPHVPADAGVTQDINSLTIPIAAANGIKRDLYQLAKKTYNGGSPLTNLLNPLEQKGAGDFASLLRKNIGQQEPGVNIPNAISSSMYKIPDVASGLSSILAMGQPRAAQAIQTVGNLPFAGLQKLFPSGGGYLNQVIPRGLQFLFGQNQGGQPQ